MVLAAAMLMAWSSGNAQTARAIHQELQCGEGRKTPRDLVEEAPVYRTPDGAPTAYRAGMDETIMYYPAIARELPNAVLKLQFAEACLQILGENSDTCAIVKFLRWQNALEFEEIEQLEAYYLELGERDTSAISEIKEIFKCY